MTKVCLGVFLLVQAVLDAKTRYVYLPVLLLQAAVGIALGCLKGISGAALWVRFIPGMALLLVSFLCRGRIGRGDGWLFAAMAVYLTAGQQMLLFFCAVFLAAMWIIPLLMMGCVEKDSELAFVPFVLAAYVRGCLYGWF